MDHIFLQSSSDKFNFFSNLIIFHLSSVYQVMLYCPRKEIFSKKTELLILPVLILFAWKNNDAGSFLFHVPLLFQYGCVVSSNRRQSASSDRRSNPNSSTTSFQYWAKVTRTNFSTERRTRKTTNRKNEFETIPMTCGYKSPHGLQFSNLFFSSLF